MRENGGPWRGGAYVEGQLRLLVTLQELEVAIKRFEEAVDAKPRELEPLTRVRDEAQANVAKHRKDLEDIDKQRRQIEAEVTQDQYNLQKAQRKLLEVKTNKEYAAVLVEIDTLKQKISAREDKVLQLMELAELRKQQVQDLDRQVKEEEQRLTEARRQNEAELAVLQRLLAERRQSREAALQQLDRPVLEMYLRLLQSRKGLAVVGIKDGACEGCHLTLPPQLIQEVRRGDRLITCSHCQRILYWNREGQQSPSDVGASELVR
jgi:predicted  nucleic acid-binding Zn-ribbon protein